jgi:hypothetical protein
MRGSSDDCIDSFEGFRSVGFDDELFKGFNIFLGADLAGRLDREEAETLSSKGAGRFFGLWIASSSVSTAEDIAAAVRSDVSRDISSGSIL